MENRGTPRIVETALGPLTLIGSEEHAAWLQEIAKITATSASAKNLCARVGLGRYPIRFHDLGDTTGGNCSKQSGITLNPSDSVLYLAGALVHECAHLEQFKSYRFSYFQNIRDAFLLDRIKEASAFTHQFEAIREMSASHPGIWKDQPLPCLHAHWQLPFPDNPETRAAARALTFRAFFNAPLLERYDEATLQYIESVDPEILMDVLPNANRPAEEYDLFLASHGLSCLRQSMPDLDWNAPFWSGLRHRSHERLLRLVAEKCPDLLESALLPAVRAESGDATPLAGNPAGKASPKPAFPAGA